MGKETVPTLHVVCAWCGKIMVDAPGKPVSHGCCKECLGKELAALERQLEEQNRCKDSG